MTAPTAGELLLPGEGELDGPAAAHGHEGCAELPGPQLHLAAEGAADVGLDHPHLVLGDAEGARQEALHDVGDLGAGPEGHPAALVRRGHTDEDIKQALEVTDECFKIVKEQIG